MTKPTFSRHVFAALIAAAAVAGCSSGGGFGSPPPYPNAPQPQTTVQVRYRAVTRTGEGDWNAAISFVVQ